MWSEPRISVFVHGIVATGLLVGYFGTIAARPQHPDWYQAGFMGLLPAAIINYVVAGLHAFRLLR